MVMTTRRQVRDAKARAPLKRLGQATRKLRRVVSLLRSWRCSAKQYRDATEAMKEQARDAGVSRYGYDDIHLGVGGCGHFHAPGFAAPAPVVLSGGCGHAKYDFLPTF